MVLDRARLVCSVRVARKCCFGARPSARHACRDAPDAINAQCLQKFRARFDFD